MQIINIHAYESIKFTSKIKYIVTSKMLQYWQRVTNNISSIKVKRQDWRDKLVTCSLSKHDEWSQSQEPVENSCA